MLAHLRVNVYVKIRTIHISKTVILLMYHLHIVKMIYSIVFFSVWVAKIVSITNLTGPPPPPS